MSTNLETQAPSNEGVREKLLAGIPVTERRLELAGVSTCVLEGGEGPPMLLLHGPGGYGAIWQQVIPELTSTRRVVAPDLPGHGGSSMADGQAGRRSGDGVARRVDRADVLDTAGPRGPTRGWRYRRPLRRRARQSDRPAGARSPVRPRALPADTCVRRCSDGFPEPSRLRTRTTSSGISASSTWTHYDVSRPSGGS